MFVPSRLLAVRQQRGLEPAELAARLHRPCGRVLDWESGRLTPAPRSIAALARVLGVAATALLEDPPDDLTLGELRRWARFGTHDMAERLGLGGRVYIELEQAPTRPLDADLVERISEVLGVRPEIVGAAAARTHWMAVTSTSDRVQNSIPTAKARSTDRAGRW